MATIDDILEAVEAAVRKVAKEQLPEYASAATKDGKAFLKATREDLARYATLLSEGKLTPDEFTFLLGSKKDLLELEALKQLGLAQARLARFRRSLVSAVAGAVISAVS